MKYIIPVFLFSLFSCSSKKNSAEANYADSTITTRSVPDNKAKPYATTDTVVIASKHFDTLIYSRQAFNEIVDNFPSLYSDIPLPPDLSYAQSGYFKDIKKVDGTTTHLSFGSEQGQDNYYILYTYFLKQQNKGAKADSLREMLIAAYENINDIFSYLNRGGTFFGHQFYRLNAYAEYGVYQYEEGEINSHSPSFARLKTLYLASLKEIIRGWIQDDIEVSNKSKKEQQEKILKHVANLNSLITNDFLLKKVQQFQYYYY